MSDLENAIRVARANLDEAQAWYAAAHARYVALDRAYLTRPDPDESQEAYDAAADISAHLLACDDLTEAEEAYDAAVRDFGIAVYAAANHRGNES